MQIYRALRAGLGVAALALLLLSSSSPTVAVAGAAAPAQRGRRAASAKRQSAIPKRHRASSKRHSVRHKRAAKTEKVPDQSTASSAGARLPASSSLADTALIYQGVPYRYAGMTSRGMDCSGLVARVLRLNGVDAPHSSRALYQFGTPVARGDLQPDDLVFFRTRGRGISHVGIYIGEGQFVHASSGRGRVQVDTLESGYYAARYVGARRLH